MRTTARTSRKQRACSRCFREIKPGDVYAEHVASPDHDGMGNQKWWRIAECLPCCATCGRPVAKAVSAQ